MISSEVLSLADKIHLVVQNCNEPGQSEEAEKTLLNLSRKLTAELESPFDVIRRIAFQPYETIALRVAIQLGLLDVVNDDVGRSAKELATTTAADHLLIIRIMRVLCATGVFQESGIETYKAGRLASAFRAQPALKDNVSTLFDFGFQAAVKLPSYLRKTRSDQASSVNDDNSLWQYALNTPFDFWTWLKQDPERVRAFNSSMIGRRQTATETAWFRRYPVVESLYSNSDLNEVLLVDVGGGRGQDMVAFRNEFPSLPGRLILQDQRSTVSEINMEAMESRGIEVLPHNFFDPQPVKGARAYYFHDIFHDWPDSECRAILKQTVAVMKSAGKSKLLIEEYVVPKLGVSRSLALRDMHMMTLFGSMERTERQWIALLGQEGLEIVNIWELRSDGVSLIEAILTDPSKHEQAVVDV